MLGRSFRRLMVQSLFDRLGIKQWVDALAFEPFKGLINSWILLFLSYIKKYKIIEIMKIIVRRILPQMWKYWTIRRLNHLPSNPATQRIILQIDWFLKNNEFDVKLKVKSKCKGKQISKVNGGLKNLFLNWPFILGTELFGCLAWGLKLLENPWI